MKTNYSIETIKLTKTFLPNKGLAKLFGHSTTTEPVTAVNEVDLKIKRGELFGLLGPNGAGKTTLIKILATLIVPTSGQAFVDGWNVETNEERVRNSIGLVGSEERSFYWRLSGRRNLEFFSALHGLMGEKMHKRIDEVLALMGLESFADKVFQGYSTGTKQKMCIARGLLTDPAVLFLDEPTRSLDPLAAESIRNFIKDVLVRQQERTVILTTHRLEEASQICDRIAIMECGRIKACGTLDELRAVLSTQCKYEITVGGVNDETLQRITKTHNVPCLEIQRKDEDEAVLSFVSPSKGDLIHKMISALVDLDVRILDCRSREASLEEMFAQIVCKRESESAEAKQN